MRSGIETGLILLLVAATAEARPPRKGAKKPVAAAAPVTPEESPRTRAEAEADKATLAFKLGRFDDALAGYTRAYELFQASGLLFNIGQCHRQRGDHAKAIFFLSSYLRETPHAKNAAVVTQLIADEQAKQTAASQPASQPRQLAAAPIMARATPPSPPAAEPVYTRWWFWTAIGGGLAVIAGVTTAVLVAQSGTPSGSLGTLDRRQ